MSNWKLMVNWLLPPPLILTVLLILPMPAVVRKGLLQFVRSFLFCPLVGAVKLVHTALLVTAVAFAATSYNTYLVSRVVLPETLTPNQKTAMLARRWREERNFWIACLTFLLWGLLYRFYALLQDYVRTSERVRYLEAVVAKLPATGTAGATGSPRTTAPAGAKAAAAAGKGGKGMDQDVEPSAPPAPAGLLGTEPKKVK